MIFEILVVGPLAVNCFILGCEKTKEAVIVDPGADASRILGRIEKMGLTVKYVINTHGHFDHVGGNNGVLKATGAPLLVHAEDIPQLSRSVEVARTFGLSAENSPPPSETLKDGMTLAFGSYAIKVLHTPGHTAGGCCLYLESEGVLLSGDTLFAESVGRTDFPGSSHEALIRGIRTKLLTLPDETKVYPGHGESTTIGHERLYNEYLR